MSRITAEICEKAIKLATPAIVKFMDDKVVKCHHLHIVAGSVIEGSLVTTDFGDRTDWENEYDKVAESKFELTVEHKMPTRWLQQNRPEVLGKPGTTIWWGSWIDGDIVCACSGVQPWMDEMISKIIIDIIRGLIYQVQDDEFQEQLLNGSAFY